MNPMVLGIRRQHISKTHCLLTKIISVNTFKQISSPLNPDQALFSSVCHVFYFAKLFCFSAHYRKLPICPGDSPKLLDERFNKSFVQMQVIGEI